MFTSSLAAEAAFYAAFSNGDIDAMMSTWGNGVELACIHPQGPCLRSRSDIHDSWALILGQPVMRRFDLQARVITGADNFRIHQLEEHISVPGTNFVAPPVLATNVYQCIDHHWYIVVHHGSVAPTPPPPTSTANNPPSRLH